MSFCWQIAVWGKGIKGAVVKHLGWHAALCLFLTCDMVPPFNLFSWQCGGQVLARGGDNSSCAELPYDFR